MKKILLALSLLYLAFCGELACLSESEPSKVSDCLQRTPKKNDNMCCYAEFNLIVKKEKACIEAPKALNSDKIKKQLIQQNQVAYPGLTIEDFSCRGSYLKMGLLLLAAFLL